VCSDDADVEIPREFLYISAAIIEKHFMFS